MRDPRQVAFEKWLLRSFPRRKRGYRHVITAVDKIKSLRRRQVGLTAMRSAYGTPHRRKRRR